MPPKVASKSKVRPKSTSSKKVATNKPKSIAKQSTAVSVSSKVISKDVKLKPVGAVHSNSGYYDCCALLVHCAKHDKILVARQEKAVWMPFTQMLPNRSWKHGAMWSFCAVLAGASSGSKFAALKTNLPVQSHKCLQVLRVQLPQTQKFFTRLIYYFQLDAKSTDFKCCQPIVSTHLEWLPMADIKANKVANLWGPELIQFAQAVSVSENTALAEYSLEEALLFVPRNPPRNLEEELLKSMRITEKDVERLYADFVEHCFPCLYQTVDSFKCYMAKYDCEKNEARLAKLFTAFNVSESGFLSFHELLLGLACIEPTTQHGEFRAKFIFRYYDTDNSNSLSQDELKVMLTDMGTLPEQLDSKLKEAMNIIGTSATVNGRKEVSIKDLVTAIGSHKFRGTHILCRSAKSIFTQICKSICQKVFRHQTGSKTVLSSNIKANPTDVCLSCSEKKFEIALHQLEFNMEGPGPTAKRLPQVAVDNKPKQAKGLTAQQYSVECVFNESSAANAVIKLVRMFNATKGTAEEPLGLMQDKKDLFWKLLLALYNDANILLEGEFKCQKSHSPCYIIGDVHGNLEDLLSMEHLLWKQMPAVTSNFVFLGDYVDRGQWGLECSLYLMALKILCPNKITLLRGNHEVRELQLHYTYKKECLFKYDDDMGPKVWELTNRLFDMLPVCALVDEAIFCAHGGIPRSAQQIEQIVAIKRDLRDPEEESAIAWEILWSDPSPMTQFIDVCQQKGLNPDEQGGYVSNVKRGTAFMFSDVGATAFLRNNFLTHIIRAHEVAPAGYEFHFGSKCVTIFSCSHYCGNDNLCGLILACDQRMRVIVIDTANNSAATD